MANTVIPNTLPFRPILAHALGINAALVLADIERWTKYAAPKAQGWVYKSIPDLCAETGLSRYQQDVAVELLIRQGLIEYRIARTWVRHFRIKTDAVDKLIRSMSETNTLVREKVARKADRKSHTITIRTQFYTQKSIYQKPRPPAKTGRDTTTVALKTLLGRTNYKKSSQ